MSDRRCPGTSTPGASGSPRWPAAVAAIGMALVVASFAVPRTLAEPRLSSDSIEHLTIANSWVHGRGWVNPIRWHFYLPESLPLPGFATRPPAVSVLLAAPLGLGASLEQTLLVHVALGCLLAGAVVLVACRHTRLPAALGTGLLVGLSAPWVILSANPFTEMTGVLAFLLVLCSARGVLRSIPLALVCSAATCVGWTARPLVFGMAVSIVVAAVWELGPRRAVRHAPLAAYVLGVAVLMVAIVISVEQITGLAPYAAFGGNLQMLDIRDEMRFGHEYPGSWRFVSTHLGRIVHQITANSVLYVRSLLLDPMWNYTGWMLVPALLHALTRRPRGSYEYRILAFSAVGMPLVLLVTYAMFSPVRFPMFTAIPTAFCGMMMIDDLAHERSRASGRIARFARSALPLALAITMVSCGSLSWVCDQASASWAVYRAGRGEEARPPTAIACFCPRIPRDAVVAAIDPWAVALRCGQRSVILPLDLTTRPLQDRFLDSQGVGYLWLDGEKSGPALEWVASSDRLERVARTEGHTLFRVRNPVAPKIEWQAPPALAPGASLNCEGFEDSRAAHR